MRKYPEIEQKIYDWMIPIALKVGLLSVSFDGQNQPQPMIPYMSIAILNVSMDSRPEIRMDYEPAMLNQIQETAIYRGEIELMIKIISDSGAMGQAEAIKGRMWMAQSLEAMRFQNIGHKDHGDTIDRSSLIKSGFRQRADFVLQLHVNATYSELIGTIGSVPIEGEDQDNRTIMDETITE
jgi:hypothetical protein